MGVWYHKFVGDDFLIPWNNLTKLNEYLSKFDLYHRSNNSLTELLTKILTKLFNKLFTKLLTELLNKILTKLFTELLTKLLTNHSQFVSY